ncbi:hypothetical protein [Nonomuraea sp. NPDC050643]|uniref:hypothetical protein n=1 Tax=Nonomuraea sp. NPDC050643 TaxID=3155660 RepID=UPI00340BB87B
MAGEWVAPVVAGASGITGAGIGAYFTWRTARHGRDHVERMANKTAESQLALAREAHKVEAYAQLSSLIIAVSALYASDPLRGHPPGMPIPTFESLHEQTLNVTVNLGLHGSKDVRNLYREWGENQRTLFEHDARLQMSVQNRADLVPISEAEYKDALEALAEANKRLREQMNKELTS